MTGGHVAVQEERQESHASQTFIDKCQTSAQLASTENVFPLVAGVNTPLEQCLLNSKVNLGVCVMLVSCYLSKSEV